MGEKEGQRPSRWPLRVDHRERRSGLFCQLVDSGLFDLRIEPLEAGDYIINERIVVERKTIRDFAISVIDGRLFAQAASLKRVPLRQVILVEGPKPGRMPRVHPRALKGALLSLAVAWRLPVVFSSGFDDSLNCLQMLAEQSQACRPRHSLTLGQPFGSSRKKHPQLSILQGLPKVGPRLAAALLERFGSVREVLQAGEGELASTPGCGPNTARIIHEVLNARFPG